MSKCIEDTSSPIISFSENGKSAIFKNHSRLVYQRARVDGCLIDGPHERCDFFLRNDDTIYLIELKGKHIGKAVSQVISTAHLLAAEIKERACRPVIVVSRSPAIAGAQKELRKFTKCGCRIDPKQIILRSKTATVILP